MGSFDYLLSKTEYKELHELCNSAEVEHDIIQRSILCRKALILIIEKIYCKQGIHQPEMATMLELVNSDIVVGFFKSNLVIESAHFIRKVGANAEHGAKVKRTQSKLSFDNLVFIARYFYTKFENPDGVSNLVIPQFMSEDTTRKVYVDTYLNEAGWDVVEPNATRIIDGGIEVKCGTPLANKACCEIPVEGMNNKSGVGFCDYVLYGRNGKPLAIVEAKRAEVNASMGSFQVKEYGECMKKQYGYVPVLYYTNGYEIYVVDGLYPARKVLSFHSQEELEYMLQKRNRVDMSDLKIRDDISGRPYQKMAVTSVCEHFNKMYRRCLLVMATGTGKTRVSISIVELMLRNKWIKNVLFLADRTSLVSQAADNFSKILPDLELCILSDKSKSYNPNARLCFSTHQTMINYIDAETKEFTIGRFDLIIVDEAHRSVFNKYGSIFNYYDSLLVGLTATPKDEVDASTYQLFNCENGEPNFAYSIEEAVKEKYLVPYQVKNMSTKILTDGSTYGQLSDTDKELVESINEGELDEGFELRREEFFNRYFNTNTCSVVLDYLMNNGLKVESGQKLGKTIIFAYNHKHAQMIVDTFKKDFPYNDDYCQLIDNQVKHADQLIRQFESNDDFRIAVSVDMLDTGIDVPSVLNLVFFKPVKSKIKFVQMIGRGTRLCSKLIDGNDKTHFLIFDYCGNFEFFQMNPEGANTTQSKSLSQRLFDVKLDMLVELQSFQYQENPLYVDYYLKWKEELYQKVNEIRNSSSRISVRQELPYVDKFSDYEKWTSVSPLAKKEMQLHLSKLIANDLEEDVGALRFDMQFFQIELSVLAKGNITGASKQVKNVRLISKYLLERAASQPAVKAASPTLKVLMSPEYWNDVDMLQLEKSREVVRNLLVYLPGSENPVDLSIADSVSEGESIDTPLMDIRTYKEKVIDYILANNDNETILKIKNLEQINADDLRELERILWQELGTQEEYKQATSIENLAAFIRSIVGIDQSVVNEKFGEYLNDNVLNSKQQEFVKSIIDYVRENGDICKEDLLYSSPFDHSFNYDDFDSKISIINIIIDRIHNSIIAA